MALTTTSKAVLVAAMAFGATGRAMNDGAGNAVFESPSSLVATDASEIDSTTASPTEATADTAGDAAASSTPISVPEPSMLGLIGITVTAMLIRRRREAAK